MQMIGVRVILCNFVAIIIHSNDRIEMSNTDDTIILMFMKFYKVAKYNLALAFTVFSITGKAEDVLHYEARGNLLPTTYLHWNTDVLRRLTM